MAASAVTSHDGNGLRTWTNVADGVLLLISNELGGTPSGGAPVGRGRLRVSPGVFRCPPRSRTRPTPSWTASRPAHLAEPNLWATCRPQPTGPLAADEPSTV